MAEYTNQSSSSSGGYAYADNDINFKQNLLKISQNPEVGSDGEKYRHKEYTDSFLTDFDIWCVDNYSRAMISYIEIDKEFRRNKFKELMKENKSRALEGKSLIDVKETVNKMPFLRPTINATFDAIKNITQLAKSRNGIAVRTATTQKVIQTSFNRQEMQDQTPRGLFGQAKKSSITPGDEMNGRPY